MVELGILSYSELHHTVRAVGEFFGYKFRPWKVVNLAADIGKFVMVVGEIIGVVAAVVALYQQLKEQEREEKFAEERKNITSQFIKMAENLKTQIERQIAEVEAQFYGEIEKKIAEARRKEEKAIVASNTLMKQLV